MIPQGRRLPLFINNITDVAERQLCSGCGMCAYVQPEDIEMVDDIDAGRRPVVKPGADTARALQACPGVGLDHEDSLSDEALTPLRRDWGPVLEVWEGHASDAEIRYAGSSGGAATALALDAIVSGEASGALHIKPRSGDPLFNEPGISRTREELLRGSGSRYSPASPCERLDLALDAPAPVVFIGKPCDVAAVERQRAVDPRLDAAIGLTIAVFCAGVPSTRGTLQMLKTMGVDDPADVGSVRYRGHGWPGRAAAIMDDGSEAQSLSYDESWGAVLQQHRQWRCYVCADHTGEFADIAVGDPWYREADGDDPGRNLILARTERGRRALHDAIARRSLVAQQVDAALLPASQPGLRKVRGAVFGRIVACRLVGIPAPIYRGFPTWSAWIRQLTWRERMGSVIGVWRRAIRRGLFRRHLVRPRW